MGKCVSRPALLLIGVLLTGMLTPAAGQTSPERQKVGVALSGGGALGLAHIGVLKYFEEQHIPIDYVAGTSMGGLVGGFYATGATATDLEKTVDEANWEGLLSPSFKFTDQPVAEKQDWDRPVGTFSVPFGKRFALPAGLNSGQQLWLLLSRHTAAYGTLNSFDDLPTPFRCVATDLVKGKSVVLDHGPLAKALRATMAIPGIFTPVLWDDMVLIDGGVLNNLPADIAKQMGAGKVIAVTVESDAPKKTDFKSLGGVLRQTVSTIIADNERRNLANADLVLRVKTGQLSGSGYDQAKQLVQLGYQAAKANAAELAPYSLTQDEWDKYIAAREQRTRRLLQSAPVVAVGSTQPVLSENATHELHRKLGDGPIPQDKLEGVLIGVVAATGSPGAYYSQEKTPAGTEGYRVDFLERAGQILLLRPTLFAQLSNGEPVRVALRLGATVVPQDTYKSRYLGQAEIGYDPGLRVEYYHPFDGSPYFVAPGFLVQRYHDVNFEGSTWQNFIRDRFAATLYGGIGTWRFVQLRLGVQTGYDSYNSEVESNGIVAHSQGFANPEMVWIYNSQDAGGLPSRGTRIEGSAGYSLRTNSYPYFKNEISTFHPVQKHVTLFGQSRAATSFGRNLNYFNQFPVGGEGQLDAYRYQEFHANTFVSATGGAIFRGPGLKSLSIYPAVSVWYSATRLDLGALGWQTHQSTSIGMFFPTPVGSAGLSVSFNENGKAKFRLSIGSF